MSERTQRSSTLVKIDGVGYHYPDGTQALADVSLDIPAGKVIGLCGPSGCGKSTLLSLLAGIRKPTSGTIAWNDAEGE